MNRNSPNIQTSSEQPVHLLCVEKEVARGENTHVLMGNDDWLSLLVRIYILWTMVDRRSGEVECEWKYGSNHEV